MPMYDYICDACEHKFEELHAMGDKPSRICPK